VLCLRLQEVWYQLSFEGYPESDAEWFPASRIRSEHPQGDELIAAFDRGLETSGQGDVALPPHAAERAAALSVGTPQVGVSTGWSGGGHHNTHPYDDKQQKGGGGWQRGVDEAHSSE
jgi:hypothetical protein